MTDARRHVIQRAQLTLELADGSRRELTFDAQRYEWDGEVLDAFIDKLAEEGEPFNHLVVASPRPSVV